MIVVLLFLAVPWVCLQFVIVVFPDHTHSLYLRLISHVTHIKHVFFHFVVYLFKRYFLFNIRMQAPMALKITRYSHYDRIYVK